MTQSVKGKDISTLIKILPESLNPKGFLFKWAKHTVGSNSTVGVPSEAFITRVIKYGELHQQVEDEAKKAFTDAGYKVSSETLQVSSGAIMVRIYFYE